MALMAPLRSTFFAKGSEFYEISDSYDLSLTGFAGDYEYWGYLNTSGAWIIQRHQISTGQYRYIQGADSFATNFANIAILVYDYYDTLYTIV